MQLNLTAEEESYIEEKLAEGFETPQSVVAAAIALMRQRDEAYSAWLREQAEEGLRALDDGRWVEATPELREEIKRRGRERLKARQQKTA